MNTSKCHSCGTNILWARTRAGKAIPLDPEPTADGNIVLAGGRAYQLGKGETPADPEARRYRSHFVTCPDRRKWRKPQGD